MKFIPLFCFLSLLVLFNTKPLQGAEPVPVLDGLLKPLKPGEGYYVRLFWEDRFGALKLGRTRNKPCPLDVIRNPQTVGSPVYFSAPGLSNILTETDLTIEIPNQGSPCTESKIWKLSKEGSRLWFVSTGGVAGDPLGKFQIEELKGDFDVPIYFFKFCPSVPGALCSPVGTFTDTDGTKVLAVGDDVQPYHVRFPKVFPSAQEENQDLSIV